MAMPERLEKLRAAVEDLERELHSLEEVDPETRLLLEEARREIHDALSREQHESLYEGPLSGRLESAARRFEATHPTLAGVLERLVNGLAQLGI
jgi:chromosome segregation ATPase